MANEFKKCLGCENWVEIIHDGKHIGYKCKFIKNSDECGTMYEPKNTCSSYLPNGECKDNKGKPCDYCASDPLR